MTHQNQILEDVLETSFIQLNQFASQDNTIDILSTAFGDRLNKNRAREIILQWSQGNWQNLPKIEISSELGNANGAYVGATNTIYLSQNFLNTNQNNVDKISAVLIEEIGHYLDREINVIDSLGDEGNIFSKLVRGISISELELEALKKEDDTAIITINNESVLAEMDIWGDIVDTVENIFTPRVSIDGRFISRGTTGIRSGWGDRVDSLINYFQLKETFEVTSVGKKSVSTNLVGKWNKSTITYSFDSTITTAVRNNIIDALDKINSIIGLNIRQADNGRRGDIEYGILEDDFSGGAYASGRNINRSELVWDALAFTWRKEKSASYNMAHTIKFKEGQKSPDLTYNWADGGGSYEYATIIHETLHTLGLNHPGDYNGRDKRRNSYTDFFLPENEEHTSNTVMSYNRPGAYSSSPMPYDIEALIYLYGSAPVSDDTYTFTDIDEFSFNGFTWGSKSGYTKLSLLGGSGVTLDLSGVPSWNDYYLNLNPGEFLTTKYNFNNQFTYKPKFYNSKSGKVEERSEEVEVIGHGTAIGYRTSIATLINSPGDDEIIASSWNNTFAGYSPSKYTGSDIIRNTDTWDTLDLSSFSINNLQVNKKGSYGIEIELDSPFSVPSSVEIPDFYLDTDNNLSIPISGGKDLARELVRENSAPFAIQDNLFDGDAFGEDDRSGRDITALLLSNDSDFDILDTLSITSIDSSATKGSVYFSNGRVWYHPNGQFDYLASGLSGRDIFSYTISDGRGGTDTADVPIEIKGVNDIPTANNDLLEIAANRSKVITTELKGNDFDPDKYDFLSISAIDTTSTKGLVTLSSSGIVSYDPNDRFDGLGGGEFAYDSFSYTVQDKNGATDTATVTIKIKGVNGNPIAESDEFEIAEDDGELDITSLLLSNDTDPNVNDILSIISAESLSFTDGIVTFDNGIVTYNPGNQFQDLRVGDTEIDRFRYIISDGKGGSDTAYVEVTVTGSNDAPIAEDDLITIEEDSGSKILWDIDDNDIDPDFLEKYDLEIVTLDSTDTIGQVSIYEGIFGDKYIKYDPNEQFDYLAVGETVIDRFSYTLEDPHGLQDTATVTLKIVGENDAPVAGQDVVVVAESDGAIDITTTLLSNDSDIENDDLFVTGIDTTSWLTPDGIVEVNNGRITYNPNGKFENLGLGETDTDSFYYLVSDEHGAVSRSLVTITIQGENDAPIANDDTVTISEDSGQKLLWEIDDNDIDPDFLEEYDLEIISFDATNTKGKISTYEGVFGDIYLRYDPNKQFESLGVGETATDTFSYTIQDPHGASDSATVTVVIEGENDRPDAIADTVVINEDDAGLDITTLLLANDSDRDTNDTLSITAIDTSSTNGLVTFTDGTIVYNPGNHYQYVAPGETATDTFNYTVSDGNGGSQQAEVTIIIEGSEDPGIDIYFNNNKPSASNDTIYIDENSGAVDITDLILKNDTDPEEDILSIIEIDPNFFSKGIISLIDGRITYSPDGQFADLRKGEEEKDGGFATFSYTVSDGKGGKDEGWVDIFIQGENDAPIANDDTVTVSESFSNILTTIDDNDNDVDYLEKNNLEFIGLDTTNTKGKVSISQGASGTKYIKYDTNGQFQSLGAGETATDSFSYTIQDPHGAKNAIAEFGTIFNLTDAPQVINLQNTYINPVVLVQPLSFAGSQPAIPRLMEVNADSFTVFTQEPNYLDGGHIGETASYFVIEAGSWRLPDGTFLEAGIFNDNKLVNQGFQTINFDTNFNQTPVTFSQIQTFNGSDFVKTRQKNTTADYFQIGMEKEEALATTGQEEETIGWLAIDSGVGTWDGHVYQAGTTGDRVTHNFTTLDFSADFTAKPHFLASLGTYDGVDSASLRYDSLNQDSVTIKVEEEMSADAEINHTHEDVNFFAIEGSGVLTAAPLSELKAMGEFGTISNLTHLPQAISFKNTYNNPVIFAQTLSSNDEAPAIVRFDNLNSDSVTAFIQETNNSVNGGTEEHLPETVSYLILEAGVWELSDGTILEVGTLDSEGQVTSGFDSVSFSHSFPIQPLVFSQVQTNNGSDFVRTRQKNPTLEGFELGMEEEEANVNTNHILETLGWFALTPGKGNWNGYSYEATTTGDKVTDKFTGIDFFSSFNEIPNFLAALSSYDGSDSAGLRHTNLTTQGVEVRVEEDTSLDSEITHITETVDYLVLAGEGSLTGKPYDPIPTEDTATVVVTIEGKNDNPIAEDDAITLSANKEIIDLTDLILGNDRDPDTNDSYGISEIRPFLTKGTLNLIDGRVTYSPNGQFVDLPAGEEDIDSFYYTIDDGNGGSDEGRVRITIQGENDAPIANDDTVTISEDSSGTTLFTLDDNDTDPDFLEKLEIVGLDITNTKGKVSISQGASGTKYIKYDPNERFESLGEGETATDTFTYTVADPHGATDSATVTVIIEGENDAPIAASDTIQINNDNIPIDITSLILDNDTDPDANDSFTITQIDPIIFNEGTLNLIDGRVIYNPNGQFVDLRKGYEDTDSFFYTIDDGNGGSDQGLVRITIQGENDAPIANDDTVTISEDSSGTTLFTLDDNDTDPDFLEEYDLEFIGLDTTNTKGKVSISQGASGTKYIKYDPNERFESLGEGETATDTFTYTVADPHGATDSATVTVIIEGENDAPIAASDTIQINNDNIPIDITSLILDNDTDPDANDSFTITQIERLSTEGTLNLIDGRVIYNPNGQFVDLRKGEEDSDSFYYTIDDGNGGSDEGLVQITIQGENDAPIANDDTVTISEDSSETTLLTLDNNDTDPDFLEEYDLEFIGLDTTNTKGKVSISQGASGTKYIKYDPNERFESLGEGETATDTFTYTVADPHGATDTATVTVIIEGENDAPIAASDTIQINNDNIPIDITSLILDNDRDPDTNDTITITSISSILTDGLLTLNDGAVTYNPNGQFDSLTPGEIGSDQFRYTITDSQGRTDTAFVDILVKNEPESFIGEYGLLSLNHNVQTIELEQTYNNPVIFAAPVSYNGSAPAIVRFDNLTEGSFDAFVQEANYDDGIHVLEEVSYFVFEAGTWELDNGAILEVGTQDISGLVTGGFDTIDFSASFGDTPTVFSQVQSYNGSDFVRTRQKNLTPTGVLVGMEEEELLNNSDHIQETVGWLAITSGSGTWDGNNYAVGTTDDIYTHNWTNLTLDGFSQAPQFLANIASYDGSDSSGLRYQNLDSTGVSLKIEEDTSKDLELFHTDESISFLALEGSGLLTGIDMNI